MITRRAFQDLQPESEYFMRQAVFLLYYGDEISDRFMFHYITNFVASKKKAPPRVNATMLCYCDSNEIGVNQYSKLPNGVSRSTLFSFPPQE
jgi:hypothetical protein